MSAESINIQDKLKCKDMASKKEPNDFQPEADDLLETTECSNDYLDQMMKKLIDRDIALYEGVFLESHVSETPQVCLDQVDEQSLLSVKDLLLTDKLKKADNNEELDKLEMIVENSSEVERKLHLEKISTAIDDVLENDDLLSSKRPLIVDTLDNSNTTNEQSLEPADNFSITHELEVIKLERIFPISSDDDLEEISAAIDDVIKNDDEKDNDKQDLLSWKKPLVVDALDSSSNVKKIPVHKLKNTDMLKAFSQSILEDTDSQIEESEAVIHRIQNLNWLKSAGSNTMDKRKTARKYLFDKEESYIDIKEELAEDTKTNSKSSRKRSGQPRNRKSKVADSSKQDGAEDKNKKKSSDVESACSAKNEICHTQAVENSQDTESIHPLGSQKMSIGRGDKRKISLGNSKPRGKSNDRERRNRTRRNSSDVKLSQMVEKNSSKNEANSSSQGSSDKVEKISTDSTKPIDQEDWETEVDSRLPKNVVSSRNRSPVKNTARKQKDQEDWETGAGSQVYKNVEASRNQLPVKNTARKQKDQEDWETGADSQVRKNIELLRNQPPEATTTRKPKDQEDWETELDLQVKKKVEPLHSQSTVKNTGNYNQPSTQECKVEINIKKEQLPSREDYQESKNRSDTNLPSRPIYGRSVEKSNLEKMSPPMQGFGQSADKNRPFQSQNLGAKHNLNDYPEQIHRNQNNGRYNDMRTSQSFREENYSNKYSSCSNTYDQDFPRWSQNNHSDKQNVKSSDWTSHTSHRHRIVVEEENKDTFGKNQGFTDRNQGSKRYPDNYQENRASNGRYNFSTEQQRNSDRLHGAYSDRYFDKNQSSRGFSERFHRDKYSNKFLDDNSSSDKHADNNQQIKTSSERFSNKTHDENEVARKNQELHDRNYTSFDRKKTVYDQPQTNVTISSDFSIQNQEFAEKNESSNLTKEACNKIHPVNEDYSGHYLLNKDNNSTVHFEYEHNYLSNEDNNSVLHLCEAHYKDEQERLSKMLKHCQSIVYQDVNHKSHIKSQKDSDNTQQANVQKEFNQVEPSYSVPSAACQQDLSSSFDQNIGMYGRDALLTNIKDEPCQSEDWNSHKNTLKHDAAQSIELQNAYLQYNQAMLASSNQLGNISPSGLKPNILMAFEGNHNVQRALGIDPRSMSQSPASQVGSDDQSRSDAYSAAPSQPQCSSYCRSAAGNPQTALAYTMSSAMNVNAPAFEVTKQPAQEFSSQQVYAAQSTGSNHVRGGVVSLDNNCAVDPLLMNVISNYSNEYVALHQEISELSKTLATKQAQLLAMQVKLMKSARLTDKVGINATNQKTILPIQPSASNQVVQEQSQSLPSNYAHRSCPPGFSNVLLNVQSTQMNSYEMLASTANHASENFTSEPKILNRSKHLLSNVNQGNMMYQHQQQTANYQMFNDQTAGASTYVNRPQRAAQRQSRDSGNQFAQQ